MYTTQLALGSLSFGKAGGRWNRFTEIMKIGWNGVESIDFML